jgi:O-antigen/teichoic acid export membrane protein
MNVQQKKTNVLMLQGAFILTIAALITKILSAVYRVPFQNIVGDVGFYIYQQVYPFYGVAIILATSGFPVMISKIISEHSHNNDQEHEYKVLSISFFFLIGTAFLFFILLFFGSTALAQYMGDQHLSVLLKVISLSFLTLPFVSLLRGYFQSKHDMRPFALSQVVEQFIRVVSILIVSYLFTQNGYNLYLTGAGAIFGSLLGNMTALFVLLIFWKKNSLKNPFRSIPFTFHEAGVILKRLLVYSATICFSSLLLIWIQMVDSFSLYSLLTESGMREVRAKEIKGIYDRGQPLLQLGTIVATSIALSIVPAIAQAKEKIQFVQEKVALAYKICFALGVPATLGIVAIIGPLNMVLFTDLKGTDVLSIYCLSILLSSIAITTAAILQGVDDAELPVISIIAGILMKWGLNHTLIPLLGTMGAAISTVFAYGVVALLNISFIQRSHYRFREYKSMMIIFTAAFFMFGCVKAFMFIFDIFVQVTNRWTSMIEVLLSVIIGVFVYVIIIIKSKAFQNKELLALPFYQKVLRKEGQLWERLRL